ncbi:sulfotransferase [Rhizorhabdus dicambivorans]|uniref:Sulfotransferase n=2 Tax=Rhizorhabdus dicambivorans TaxID=1850238 RepID=A0A2A4FVA2_9SPHN|nr:sulfotransferase [Rhizorhabdus dicambivorans]PCE42112.1 sulfotransferase [Rhizorhabdus dicambivorans]
MKAATSTLHMQLAAQPGIFMATPKEPNFFGNPDRWALGLGWYQGLFAAARTDDLCGEASTHYTKLPTLPDALPRLRDTIPDARLIYMMRHPIERLVSHYSHGWLERSIDGPIETAIEHHPELIDYGRYAMQIAPWITAFGRDAILPVFAERLAIASQQELERACRHIGYAGEARWDESIARQNVSGERLRDSPWRDRLVDHPLVGAIRRRLVPRSVRNRIKRHWQMREQPALSDALHRHLTGIFDHDLADLGRLLGTPLDCARFRDVVRERPLSWA